VALRTAYDDGFQEFSRQVLSLQSLLRHATPDREAILEARRRVEQAQSAYRESRDLLAQFILGRDVKPAHRNVDSSCQVERLAHQLWELGCCLTQAPERKAMPIRLSLGKRGLTGENCPCGRC